MSAVGYVPVDAFLIDDDELQGLSNEKCFVLGVEWALFRAMLLNVDGEFTYEVHEENRARIHTLCVTYNRDYEMEIKDAAETWIEVMVTGKPRLRVV